MLPMGVPGSYSHSETGTFNKEGTYSCSINYVMYIDLKHIDPAMTEVYGTTAAPLIMMEKLNRPVLNHIQHKFVKLYKTWFCLDKGATDIECIVEKDVTHMSDQIHISVVADNSRFLLEVNDLEVLLIREITIRNKKGETKSDCDTLWKGSLGVIGKGQKFHEPRNLFVKIFEIDDRGGPKSYGGTLDQYAGKVQQSVSGTCITVKYFIEIHPEVHGCICCGEGEKMKIPVDIMAPEETFTFQNGDFQEMQGSSESDSSD